MNKEEKNMERYTLREGGRVLCPTERLEAALERLAAFEDLACGLEGSSSPSPSVWRS